MNIDLKDKYGELLLELWENAIYSEHSYALLEKIVYHQSEKENPEDLSDLAIEDLLYELATIRNQNLIPYDRQQRLKKSVVGFFGMSVGSHAALTWIMESRADVVKLIDPDIISGSNLNRLRFGWDTVGKYKVDVVSDLLLSIHPFINIYQSNQSVTASMDTLSYFDSEPKMNIIVDAVDDMKSKILLREYAKKAQIPLISAADVGDNIVLDIERYDTDSQVLPFLGRVPNINAIDFDKCSEAERRKLIIKLVGLEENSEAMLESLQSIGRNLATWPQLGATASVAGGVITTSIKKILMDESVKSGRYYLSLDNILVSDFNIQDRIQKRREQTEYLKKKFHLE